MEIARYYRQLESNPEEEGKRTEYEVLTVRKEEIDRLVLLEEEGSKAWTKDDEGMFSELDEISREINGVGHFIVGRKKEAKQCIA